ncbi:uncharacterized protein LOC131167424 [Malania oleifera]|uniref:uncharacterized protein LOC131167424 n=1 Tax=Malania oleifera TaxID=397392 RepID=UPI0025ADAC5B|nr:uncharacterized protein LOC131167424 [Malania oleifera]
MLVWNVRGLGRSRRRLKGLVRRHRVAIVAIVEPFLEDTRISQLANEMLLLNCCCNGEVGGKLWCTQNERRTLWQDLEDLQLEDHSWIVVGNFNVFREYGERIRGNPRPIGAMDEFNSCLNNCGLMEMSFNGRRFSLCNGHEEYLMRKSSDHSPMVIKFDKLEVWVEPVYAKGLLKLAAKLKKTKIALRAWNTQVFRHVDQNIKELEEHLEVLENQMLCDFDPSIQAVYLLTKLELEIWEQREETRLAQQAKTSWLKERDQNSKFFHAVVKQRRKNSVISKMNLVVGSVLNLPESIHLAATSYF